MVYVGLFLWISMSENQCIISRLFPLIDWLKNCNPVSVQLVLWHVLRKIVNFRALILRDCVLFICLKNYFPEADGSLSYSTWIILTYIQITGRINDMIQNQVWNTSQGATINCLCQFSIRLESNMIFTYIFIGSKKVIWSCYSRSVSSEIHFLCELDNY